jgi:hypothetical protein
MEYKISTGKIDLIKVLPDPMAYEIAKIEVWSNEIARLEGFQVAKFLS